MIRPYRKLMRPGEWVKNVFVLPALVFSLPRMLDGAPVLEMLAETAAAFVAFCFLSSGFYAVNDAIDVEQDRQHPVKKHRPVAAGDVSARHAFIFGIFMIVLSLAIGFAVNGALGVTLVVYCLLQTLYNMHLKRVMFVDVMAIAIGFALRATAGAAAIEVQLSIWLVLCVFFLCLYLGFVKRLCDIASARAADGSKWQSPAGYGDMIELNWLLGVSAVLALMMYLMYSLSQHALALFGSRALGFALLSPLVMIVMHRFYRRAYQGTSDSPLAALLEDRAVLVAVIAFSVGTLAILFAPQVQDVLDLLYVTDAGGVSNGQP